MKAQDVIKMVQEKEVKFVDFRFTDTRGKEQHVGVPISAFGMEKFEDGHAFDGSKQLCHARLVVAGSSGSGYLAWLGPGSI